MSACLDTFERHRTLRHFRYKAEVLARRRRYTDYFAALVLWVKDAKYLQEFGECIRVLFETHLLAVVLGGWIDWVDECVHRYEEQIRCVCVHVHPGGVVCVFVLWLFCSSS